MLIALAPIEDKLPQIIKNNSFHPEISQATASIVKPGSSKHRCYGGNHKNYYNPWL